MKLIRLKVANMDWRNLERIELAALGISLISLSPADTLQSSLCLPGITVVQPHIPTAHNYIILANRPIPFIHNHSLSAPSAQVLVGGVIVLTQKVMNIRFPIGFSSGGAMWSGTPV